MWTELVKILACLVPHLPKKKKPLNSHPFFTKARELRSWTATLPIDDPMRKEAFQDLLRLKLHVWPLAFEVLLATPGVEKMTPQALEWCLHAVVDLAMGQCNAEAERLGIPFAVVHKFNEWHRPSVDRVHRFVHEICDSDWHTTQEVITSTLSMLIAHLDQTVLDAESALASLNGDLNGIRYKGLVGQPYQSPKRRRQCETSS